MNGLSWRRYLLVGALATVPILVIPESWWYTVWYDLVGLSAVPRSCSACGRTGRGGG